tara:strand:- start:6821 stop:7438 length:618 start_codon:yes stop_codon:yes gene_type:complete
MTNAFCHPLNQLIQGLKTFPGIGDRSALRHAMHLLTHNRSGGQMLAKAIETALTSITSCQNCNNYTDKPICDICLDPKREPIICVVQNPVDVICIEASGSFKGRYFVLMGQLSPLDGISPEDLKIPKLIDLVKNQSIKEVILATNSTVEGEATAFYISNQLQSISCQCSRLALGIPIGGELEYLDGNTLAHALHARKPILEQMET